jgi:ribosomal protein S18 acetylase RimI-like enzyme
VTHALDNPAWTALTTYQAHLAVGGDLARRYPEELTSIAAVARPEHDALDELATLIADGGSTSLPATFAGIVPLIRPPLALTFTKTLVQMVCERRASLPPNDVELCLLGEPDREDMVALAALTHPGPFRSHTYRFGTYWGIQVNGVLAAMGGQRMHLPGYRELSAICTHPDFRGRGYARAIVDRLMTTTFDEGLTPFLHVEDKNRSAQALYATLGFVERARFPVVVVERMTSGR